MTILAYPKTRRRKSAQKPVAVTTPVAPPSGALLNAILSYADTEEDVGGGLTLLRISARRMDDQVIRDLLGREAMRLADVSILWNDDESEIHTVLDAATPLGIEAADPEPEFELTELALAYIEGLLDEGVAKVG
jgi:hypothetical protein